MCDRLFWGVVNSLRKFPMFFFPHAENTEKKHREDRGLQQASLWLTWQMKWMKQKSLEPQEVQ